MDELTSLLFLVNSTRTSIFLVKQSSFVDSVITFCVHTFKPLFFKM